MDSCVAKIPRAAKDGRILVGVSVKFERIRRITGYLVGTLDRFNDAKRAEERDRVKHCGCGCD
ncbi:MAG: nrdD protein [Desulfovibrio sp.]|nr:nrdD protein [Desulfovibrio sp.]